MGIEGRGFIVYGPCVGGRGASGLAFLPHVLAFDDLLVRVKLVHRQVRLLCVVGARLVMAGAVGPPLESAVIEGDLTGIEHLFAFGD